ncbi:hypothetical protein SCUCBS95973_009467 [Sporothrix curviconia]|uniref:FAD-binding domain-containing protein n=1 Tax=Sporothrix curviconia TaxID=1260050 RepID=A0ABP0CV71_9PEZI
MSEHLSTTTDVLIVGAGPTGLTLACALARSGIDFKIIDQAAGPHPGSRGKSIQPRTLEVLDDLGVIDAILEHGEPARPVLFTDMQGHEIQRTGAPGASTPATPYPSSVVTPEWRVEEALRSRLEALGGSVIFNVELSELTQLETHVTATTSTGETITARWLVGCDGGHSTVRKQSGITFLGETLEEVRMIVADVQATGLDRETWRIWEGEHGFVALCPLASTEDFSLQILLGAGANPELSLENMQAAVTQQSRRSDIILNKITWSSLWRANVRMVESYRSGRVFVAGDAAHIHSPAGGQGMNTGIQDAQNLAWKLAAVIKGASLALLNTYQEERLPVAAGVLALSSKLMEKTLASHGSAMFGRDWKTNQLGLGYRDSSLSASPDNKHDDRGIQAGDRAPDATGLIVEGKKSRLFDLLRGEHFTILCFGKPGMSMDNLPVYPWLQLRTVQLGSEVVDGSGHLANAYGLPDGAVALIRPDGYIGLVARSDCQAALVDYLAQLAGREA